jgi:SAM-dependent methyltransferase
LNLKGIIKGAVQQAARFKYIRRALTMIYVSARRNDHVGNLSHPYDRSLGISASGALPAYLLQSGKGADPYITAYLGITPSVLRASLATIPHLATRSFIDIGCGKGRALAVASEFSFQAIVGIELNPELCRDAIRNAAILRVGFPERTPIEVREGDASAPQLPDGPLVVFFYHSFNDELVKRLADNLALAAETREVLFIYVNPVHGAVFDQHKLFSRWYAQQVTIAATDVDYCQDNDEAVVIWRSAPTTCPLSSPIMIAQSNPHRAIKITKPEWRAELE